MSNDPQSSSGIAPSSASDRTAVPDDAQPLNARRATVLNAVVAEHISSGQPIGSGHLAGVEGLDVSSATIRSEMSSLERDGYLTHPHTSAGRIPTDRGYRHFVDTLPHLHPGRASGHAGPAVLRRGAR